MLILLSVPFAMVGGVFLQWMLGYPMTTAVIVGYISLFAVAVQTGIIMVIFIRGALDHRREGQSYIDAVIEGSATRLRPKLMTVAAIVLSLLPVHVCDRRRDGDHEADRRAEHRRDGHVEPARAVHDAVPVRDRRGCAAMVARRRRGPRRTVACRSMQRVALVCVAGPRVAAPAIGADRRAPAGGSDASRGGHGDPLECGGLHVSDGQGHPGA